MMLDNEHERARNARQRFVSACGGAFGVALFVYLAVVQHLIQGRVYGPKWWTNLVLGTLVFGSIGALVALLVYVRVRRERTSDRET